MINELGVFFMNEHGFAMNFEDLKFCSTYFKEIEKRNPEVPTRNKSYRYIFRQITVAILLLIQI